MSDYVTQRQLPHVIQLGGKVTIVANGTTLRFTTTTRGTGLLCVKDSDLIMYEPPTQGSAYHSLLVMVPGGSLVKLQTTKAEYLVGVLTAFDFIPTPTDQEVTPS